MFLLSLLRFILNFGITAVLWVYFIFGFLLGFGPFIVWSFFRNGVDETVFQRYYHLFFKGFFLLTQLLSPTINIKIDPRIRDFSSSIIICNHLSYLDPLLIISIFQKQKTIVKSTFFKVPFFSWMIKRSGYIPSSSKGKNMALVLRHLGNMKDYLKSGGVLFIFPEGTRSRNEKMNLFNKGAFSIARQCNVPINVLRIKNTNLLFRPGSYLFNTWQPIDIELEAIGRINPSDYDKKQAIPDMMKDAFEILENRLNKESLTV
ncbi:1-acyl-sn-glycerol-3-phosphate acyltransferase [bacterium]|nr:1-acyl-sn-glycerol-3-phosphate acyltransferase [bacterium]